MEITCSTASSHIQRRDVDDNVDDDDDDDDDLLLQTCAVSTVCVSSVCVWCRGSRRRCASRTVYLSATGVCQAC